MRLRQEPRRRGKGFALLWNSRSLTGPSVHVARRPFDGSTELAEVFAHLCLRHRCRQGRLDAWGVIILRPNGPLC